MDSLFYRGCSRRKDWLKSTGGGRGWLKSMDLTGGWEGLAEEHWRGGWVWIGEDVHVMYSVLEPATRKLAIRLHTCNRTARNHR